MTLPIVPVGGILYIPCVGPTFIAGGLTFRLYHFTLFLSYKMEGKEEKDGNISFFYPVLLFLSFFNGHKREKKKGK